MPVAVAPHPEPPLMVTITILSASSAHLPNGEAALTHQPLPIVANGPASLDGDPTWEDAEWS